MKKKVLFVIHGLDCGGAEKSIISLLTVLPADKYDINLIVGNPNGLFMERIPKNVNLIEDCYLLENFATSLGLRRKRVASFLDFCLQMKWQIQRRFDKDRKKLSYSELKWKIWGHFLPKLKGKYDLAISYMNGFPNYYVIEKVDAPKKVLWVHNEFEKLGYNAAFQRGFFEKADRVVTISESCADNIAKFYPDMKEKIMVLENISSGEIIRSMADEKEDDDYFSYQGKKILSIGRLMQQKNFELAIDSAAKIKEAGYDFRWYILGEGELRESLTARISALGLEENVILAGIRSNPYPYIKDCDVFAQTSLFEGKSIALDEAKILQKPIVITNYATGTNSITDGFNGLIVKMDPESVSKGIISVFEEDDLRNKFIKNLESEVNGNSKELEKYMELMDSLLDD